MTPEYAAPEPASVMSWWHELATLELVAPMPTRTADVVPAASSNSLSDNDNPVPLTATDQPQAPPEVRHALRVLDRRVGHSIDRARLAPAA
jgi:hypothetical protein